MREIHVSKKGNDFNDGTSGSPYLTIQKAADAAMAGDTVVGHEGEDREWVRPRNPGLSERRRITYKAAEGEKVVIKGSEILGGWKKIKDGIWQTCIDNSEFGEFNPFEKQVWGDWYVAVKDRRTSLGEVYLNGRALYEAVDMKELEEGKEREYTTEFFTQVSVKERYPDRTKYLWFAEVKENQTIVTVNFHEVNPNEELIEANWRKACFYPEQNGMDYITVRGFEMCQAATPWAPPTGDQPGLIGPRWSKGWIIEDNIIHDAKCSAVSLGKVADSGDNFYSKRLDKPGYTYQLEAVFTAEDQGWSKERIGSHIVRRNHIYDCGQNGIVGHLGCVFSEIYENYIHDISIKRDLYGWEIAGIKLHAAIDVQIHHNRINTCAAGTWLDWQTQGTRVHHNLYYDNGLDFFVEVSHGPYLADHNIFGSAYAIRNFSQGGAYVNNLVAGNVEILDVRDRATPYHLKHSTKVKGYAVVYGGDMRYFNNLFISYPDNKKHCGTSGYNGHHVSLHDYMEAIQKDAPVDVERFMLEKDPVYIDNNVYLYGATAFEKEEHNLVEEKWNPNLRFFTEDHAVYMEIDLPSEFTGFKGKVESTETLERVRLADAEFENPDGSVLTLDEDYFGEKHEGSIGPISVLKNGINKIKVW